MNDKTNEKLLQIIADKNHPSWQDAFNELQSRINVAEYGLYKGFERPQNPPPNP